MAMSHVACGLVVGCSNFGFWQSAPLSVLRYTPPSDAKSVGQRLAATLNSRDQVTPASSDSKSRAPTNTKMTFGSSGETAIEHGPPGLPAVPTAPPIVQDRPPSIDRKWPSSPQTSTIPPG